MGYAVEIPEEPGDWTVVLTREGVAWQRRGSAWHSSGLDNPKSWARLLVDRGPLTPLIPAEEPDWQAAGFTGPDRERYVQPEGVERVDAPGLDDPPAGPDYGELTADQRDDALATYGQAIDYRGHDRRIDELKPTGPIAGVCASTWQVWQITDAPAGSVTSSVTRADRGVDEDSAG